MLDISIIRSLRLRDLVINENLVNADWEIRQQHGSYKNEQKSTYMFRVIITCAYAQRRIFSSFRSTAPY